MIIIQPKTKIYRLFKMSNKESELNEQLRKQIEEFIKKYDSDQEVNTTPEKITPLTGCCWLSKGMARECFNGFTAQMCQTAANGCDCTHIFVPGGVCP
ncbi:MAG: hypothetical protein RR557_08800 [Bacilli bacterium]